MVDVPGSLRNADRAIIAPAKVRDYLLTDEAGKGEGKPGFFSRFGFTHEGWHLLADALREHARRHPAVFVGATPYGEKFEVRGPLVTPDGRNPTVRSVWQYDTGSDAPRLLSAYPA